MSAALEGPPWLDRACSLLLGSHVDAMHRLARAQLPRVDASVFLS